MNYIKEINALYDRQEQKPLSGAAVTLWYALMHINNRPDLFRSTDPGEVNVFFHLVLLFICMGAYHKVTAAPESGFCSW